jgi:hypothetical protein
VTYPNDAAKYRDVELEGSADAPETEIEVTPAMIKAGRDYLYDRALNMLTAAVDDPEFVAGFFLAVSLARKRELAETFCTPLRPI